MSTGLGDTHFFFWRAQAVGDVQVDLREPEEVEMLLSNVLPPDSREISSLQRTTKGKTPATRTSADAPIGTWAEPLTRTDEASGDLFQEDLIQRHGTQVLYLFLSSTNFIFDL